VSELTPVIPPFAARFRWSVSMRAAISSRTHALEPLAVFRFPPPPCIRPALTGQAESGSESDFFFWVSIAGFG